MSRARPVGETFEIYVDGECKDEGKPTARSAYGLFWRGNGIECVGERLKGPMPVQTLKRAELWAIKAAVLMIRDSRLYNNKFLVFTDSEYALSCFGDSGEDLELMDYEDKHGKKVENWALIKELHTILEYLNSKSLNVTLLKPSNSEKDQEGNEEAYDVSDAACDWEMPP